MAAIGVRAVAIAIGLGTAAGWGAAAEPAATTWKCSWKSPPGAAEPKAEATGLKYGKRWAYAVEIDDGPASTATVSQPLLAQFAFTDAPPGIAGGKPLPFVGTAAIFGLRIDTGNPTYLSWDQLRTLRRQGWGVANHGYRHIGNHWEPQGKLTAEQFREELFWSQALTHAALGVCPTHFVYPNGYTAYGPHLAEFGLRSGSRVGGKRANLFEKDVPLLDLTRNYLDEGVWAKTPDPLAGLPTEPKPGELVIDFTHEMQADPQSANHLRWRARLGRLAGKHGQAGDDTLWCAPTDEILDYVAAARAARVTVAAGEATLELDPKLPGTALTLKLAGLDPQAVLTVPAGTIVHRQEGTAWLTTPFLGRPGALPPEPAIELVHRGPVGEFKFDREVQVAGVRLLQKGAFKPGYALKIELTSSAGKTASLPTPNPGTQWGSRLLFAALPAAPAIPAVKVFIAPDPALNEMEIWAVRE